MVSHPASGAELHSELGDRLRTNRVKVPVYPAIVAKLQALVTQGRAGLAEMARVVTADPALAATVLGRARSAALKGAAPVESLEAAISRVGVAELVRFALASKLTPIASSPGVLVDLRRDAWRRAIISSRLAGVLAPARGISRDDALVAGLLHDFGEIAALACLEEIAGAAGSPALEARVWRELAVRHCQAFGAVLAARWTLPQPIADVIARRNPRDPLTSLIALVDRVVAVLDGTPSMGLAGLSQVGELDAGERARIGAEMGEVARDLLELEPPPVKASPRVARDADAWAEPSWPVAFEVVAKRQVFIARALSPNSISFVGPEELLPNWIAQAVLRGAFEPIDLLLHVKSCVPRDGGFEITATPFALAGGVKDAWLHLIRTTRQSPTNAARAS